VEPLIYTLLVGSGFTDPEPVRRDLENGEFSTVILYQDLSDANAVHRELPSLPAEQLDVVRRRFRLAAHIPGPLANGAYVYELDEGSAAESRLRTNQPGTKASPRWPAVMDEPYAQEGR